MNTRSVVCEIFCTKHIFSFLPAFWLFLLRFVCVIHARNSKDTEVKYIYNYLQTRNKGFQLSFTVTLELITTLKIGSTGLVIRIWINDFRFLKCVLEGNKAAICISLILCSRLIHTHKQKHATVCCSLTLVYINIWNA